MGIGIMICGLNGCGKSTLGRALAEEMGFHFIDDENLFFSRTKTNQPYTNPRSHEEGGGLLPPKIKLSFTAGASPCPTMADEKQI